MAQATPIKTNELESCAVIEKRIAAAKSDLEFTVIKYNNGAKELKAANDLKSKCAKRYGVKQNAKNKIALDNAAAAFDASYYYMLDTLAEIERLSKVISADNEKIISQIEVLKGSKAARKEEKKLSAALYAITVKTAKGDDYLADAGIKLTSADKKKAEKPLERTAEESVSMQQSSEPVRYYDPYVRPSVNIAPVNLNISSAVEKAVNQAISKLSASLDRKIEEFFGSYELPAIQPAVKTESSAYSSPEAALEENIANDERTLIEKLAVLTQSVKELYASLAQITDAYTEMDKKIKEAVELQKQTNDMQRHTLREQQGVQVNQRVINRDQLSISEEQAAIADAQNGIMEDQKRLSSAQAAIAENQRAVVETQNSLGEAMNIVIGEQKKLISAQQAIAAENEKQLDVQTVISEKQTEISELQKQMLSSQKNALKDQRSISERQMETEQLQKDTIEEVKEILKAQKSVFAKIAKKNSAPEA
jgi:hypothetical protein